MAPRLPDRYETQVRLGRDGDVEEWLATDRSLDRPVLVRILESSASQERRSEFLETVRGAAAAHHVGLSEVYAVGSAENPYSVVEWIGGVSLADRLRAGETLEVRSFLEHGPRIAAALAALHSTGSVHGAIDPGAIGFAGDQPAKLGAFGSRRRYTDPTEDTQALAATMRMAITGRDLPGVRPSQVAEGLPTAVDGILMDAEEGRLGAETLAAQLRSLPPPQPTVARSNWSWTWTRVSVALVVVALVISAIGANIDNDPDSPFLFPAVPEGSGDPARPDLSPLPIDSPSLAATISPGESPTTRFPNADDLALLADESGTSSWTTGDFFLQLNPARAGLSIAFDVDGTPARAEVSGTAGTGYRLLWQTDEPSTPAETIWSGTLEAGTNVARLPLREGGTWLLQLTRLPEISDGRFRAELNTVRFLP